MSLKNKPKNQKKIYIYSGAGISVESGLGTFRGSNGLWENHKIDDVCNFMTWERNYELVHRFYNERRKELNGKSPNQAHKIIKELQDKYGIDNVINITTNIDPFFEEAGVKNTVYLHGYLKEMINLETGNILNVDGEFKEFKNGKYKPNVVFFNEPAPQYIHLKRNRFEVKDGDVIICIGMSFNVIHPSDIMPYQKEVKTININLDETTHSQYDFDLKITKTASEGLQEALKEL